MQTYYQRKKQKEILDKFDREKEAKRAKKRIAKEEIRALCPVCEEQMDSSYVTVNKDKFLIWSCLNECQAGSAIKK